MGRAGISIEAEHTAQLARFKRERESIPTLQAELDDATRTIDSLEREMAVLRRNVANRQRIDEMSTRATRLRDRAVELRIAIAQASDPSRELDYIQRYSAGPKAAAASQPRDDDEVVLAPYDLSHTDLVPKTTDICGLVSVVRKGGGNTVEQRIRRYRTEIANDRHVRETDPDLCNRCGTRGQFNINITVGERSCQHCGASSPYDDGPVRAQVRAQMPWSERCKIQRPLTSVGYQTKNHFNEMLTKFQGKEGTVVPQEVIDTVKRLIHTYALKPHQVTIANIKQFLRSSRNSHYYENRWQIYHRATGLPLPDFTPEQESRFKYMFEQLQEPYARCPESIRGTRQNNFPSYEFVLRKFCELCGFDEVAPFFRTLKSADKRSEHMAIWRFMCRELGWTIIESDDDIYGR